MDDLLREFVTETNESLDVVDVELVRFEQDPNNAKILDNIFRLVHTIKGTCGFLNLPRLEALAHAAETLMGKFRDGLPATNSAVTLILATIDRIKKILESLERDQREPDGADDDLISDLERMVERIAAPAAPQHVVVGTLTQQTLERPLRPGEVSLDELERAFRETPVDPPSVKPAKPVPAEVAVKDDESAKGAGQTIRVTVDTLEHLMTMVSELVLTRNQLLEIVRRHDEFGIQDAAAAAIQCHRRAAGRRDEDAHAADRQCLAEISAHRARSLQRTRQADRTGNAGRRDRA